MGACEHFCPFLLPYLSRLSNSPLLLFVLFCVQIGFFRLYSQEFDFKDTVVSIRLGAYLEKKKKVWAESGKKDRQLVGTRTHRERQR